MGARRYGISLRVINSIAHDERSERVGCRGEHEERIPCLEATMYYFIYHINTINSPLVTRKAVFINERK